MEGIQVEHVSKSYRHKQVLHDISLIFEPEKIYGLIGRNGAGKSTLIKVIANRIFPDAGNVKINGLPVQENMATQPLLFCMSEQDLYDKDLKVKELFKWSARFYEHFDLEKAKDLSDRFGLDTNQRFGRLSKGYQSIFKLIAALCTPTPYVIFDEPMLGLDAGHRSLFYQLLLQEFEQGKKTFILATHLIEEITNLIDEVILIDQGKIVLNESLEKLLAQSYKLSGPAKLVDDYCQDTNKTNAKTILAAKALAGMKIATILGEKEAYVPEGLQIEPVTLQELFIALSERKERGESYE